MSGENYSWDEDDDTAEVEDSNSPKGLRKQLSALAKENKALKAERDTLAVKARGVDVNSVLAELGVTNPRVAALVPGSAEPTKEALSAWLETVKDVIVLKAPGTVTEETEEVEGESDLPEGHAEALGRISKLEQGSSKGADLEAATLQKLSNIAENGSLDDLRAAFQSL